MLRRLHPEQPEGFAFTPANQAWAEGQIAKYPEGRQASAIIPLLWRAQEQEGWLSRPAIEYVADMLDMARIRALEVATFYYMFQLRPVGDVAHVQVCGTLSCMLCGAEDLVGVCKERIARKPFERSADGMLSWEEVECLGACANAPMVQIGKDYYEDLDKGTFGWILDELRAGRVPPPGSYKGRFSSEPEGGATVLKGEAHHRTNASVGIALQVGDTVKRIDGQEPLYQIGLKEIIPERPASIAAQIGEHVDNGSETERRAEEAAGWPDPGAVAPEMKERPADISTTPAANEAAPGEPETPPALYAEAPADADDLKQLKGVGPKLETTLNALGIYRFEQIASWGAPEIAWVDARLNFKGRITRDDWIGQARALIEAKD